MLTALIRSNRRSAVRRSPWRRARLRRTWRPCAGALIVHLQLELDPIVPAAVAELHRAPAALVPALRVLASTLHLPGLAAVRELIVS